MLRTLNFYPLIFHIYSIFFNYLNHLNERRRTLGSRSLWFRSEFYFSEDSCQFRFNKAIHGQLNFGTVVAWNDERCYSRKRISCYLGCFSYLKNMLLSIMARMWYLWKGSLLLFFCTFILCLVLNLRALTSKVIENIIVNILRSFWTMLILNCIDLKAKMTVKCRVVWVHGTVTCFFNFRFLLTFSSLLTHLMLLFSTHHLSCILVYFVICVHLHSLQHVGEGPIGVASL